MADNLTLTLSRILRLLVTAVVYAAAANISAASELPENSEVVIPAGTLVRAIAPERVRLQKLRPGHVLRAESLEPVLAAGAEAIPTGSRCELVIERIDREDAGRGGWTAPVGRFVAKFRGGQAPPEYTARLRSAVCTLARGRSVELQMSLLRAMEPVRLRPRSGRPSRPSNPRSTLVLRVEQNASLPGAGEPRDVAQRRSDTAAIVPQGTIARLIVTSRLSASHSSDGDAIQAYIAEPVRVNSRTVLPAGTLFEGRVSRSVPPRWLNRPGRLGLVFSRVVLPEGTVKEVATAVSGVELDRNARMYLDAEGEMHGGPRTRKAALAQLGLSYALGKLTDDVLEEGIKAAFGAAASGTATVAARYVGIGTGVLFFVLQRGRDVRLPPYTELELTFNRALVLGNAQP
jgi:hypothetical protein